MIPYPNIDPVLFQLGPVGIRWYGIMYILGFLFCWAYYRFILIPRKELPLQATELSDLIVYSFLGLLIGARVVYMIFYGFIELLANPLSLFAVWNGGLSFHGGLLGIVVALLIYLKKKKINPLSFGDRIVLPIPIALFFGRIGNFINGELYGRIVAPEDFSLCMVFPGDPLHCRYPSQLIEGLGEGLLLFILLQVAFWVPKKRKEGSILGLFLIGYGVIRFLIEYIREPDPQLGVLFDVITMGQALSVPMIIIGLYLLFLPTKREKRTKK